MRQTKYLIKEAKLNTNTVDAEAISNELCVNLLNRVQDFIMAYIYNKNVDTKIFRSTQQLSVESYIDTYSLPFDIYAVNSISSVQQVVGVGANTIYNPIKQISEKDRGIKTGYFVAKSEIIFSPMPFVTASMLISYTKKPIGMGVSYGEVSAVTPTTVTLINYQDMTDVDDFFTVVDIDGNVLVRGLRVSQSGGTLTLPDTTGIVVGSYVVPGKYNSTVCELPDELESSMIYGLEKMIQARLSSSDINVASVFSDQQLEEIGSMFADNTGDSFTPPILEYTEWA